MPFGNFGTTLTDLARNQLLADSQVGQEMADVDRRAIQRQQMQQHNNQFLQDLALRQKAQSDQNAYLNNALAQQNTLAQMQWNKPNATTIAQGENQLAMAKLPWTAGVTPEQAAQNALAQKQLDLAGRPYDLMAQGKYVMPNGPIAQAEGQMMVDKAQRAEKMDSAVKAANGAYLSTVDMPHPIDTIWFGDRNTKIANGVRQQLSGAMPEVNELLFDRNANGGKGGFVSPDQPQAPVANPFAGASSTNAPPAAAGSTNQPPLMFTNRLAAPPQSQVVIQNGFRYQANPDGTYLYIGPAQ